MNAVNPKNISFNKFFMIFLIVHVLVWSILPFIRDLLPVDALECIYWGGLLDFGTHKHPPLAGWLANFMYNLLGKTDFSIYLLGQIFVLIGFVYIYKLGKCFLDEKQAIIAAMLLEGCHCYSYMTIFDGFNPNFLLFALFPAIVFYLYKSIKNNNLRDWVLLGITVGLGFLAKYQTILLIIPMGLYLLFIPEGRKQFKRKGLYISAIIAFLIFLPHLLWLFKHDFFSLIYFKERKAYYLQSYSGWIKYLKSPFMFLLAQLTAVLGSITIFLIVHLKYKLPLKLNENKNFADSSFLILFGLFPILCQALPGLLTGIRIHGTWGYPMVYMVGILLFYFYPLKITDKIFIYTIKWVYAAMAIIVVIMLTLFSVEKNFRSRYPYQKIADDFKTEFTIKTGKPLEYIGGYIEYALPMSIYDKAHPKMILDTYGHENPWTSAKNIKKAGAMIICTEYEEAKERTKKLIPDLPKNYAINPVKYNFTIYNKLNKKRVYDIYYVIIPPMYLPANAGLTTHR